MRISLGFSHFDSLVTATGLGGGSLVGGIPIDAVFALIAVETQDVRWRDDGVNPTPSVGTLMKVNTNNNYLIYQGPLSKFKMIAQTAGAKATVSFYK